MRGDSRFRNSGVTMTLLVTAMCLVTVNTKLTLAADPIVGQATVIDGDTIEIRGQRIRLSGMDAFEARQSCQGADDPRRTERRRQKLAWGSTRSGVARRRKRTATLSLPSSFELAAFEGGTANSENGLVQDQGLKFRHDGLVARSDKEFAPPTSQQLQIVIHFNIG